MAFVIENGVLIRYIQESDEMHSFLKIPEGTTEIGPGVFYECFDLIGVDIPDSVTVIREKAFFGCLNLLILKLPKNLSELGERAFGYCIGLRSIEIPEGIKKLNKNVFLECRLESISLPKSLKRIHRKAFEGCNSIIEIVWNSKNFRSMPRKLKPKAVIGFSRIYYRKSEKITDEVKCIYFNYMKRHSRDMEYLALDGPFLDLMISQEPDLNRKILI